MLIFNFQTELLASFRVEFGGGTRVLNNFSKKTEMQLDGSPLGCKWTEQSSLGGFLLKYIPFFKMYTMFVNNHEHSSKVIASLQDGTGKKATRFQKLCASASALTANSLPLESLLITPIQRVPRYVLLVAELLKYTPETHHDHAKLVESLTKLKSVATDINESMKRQDGALKLLNLDRKFDGSLSFIHPGRRLLHQGKLAKISRKAHIMYEFFLFNDLLIYAKKSKVQSGKWREHNRIPVDGSFKVIDIVNEYTFLHNFLLCSFCFLVFLAFFCFLLFFFTFPFAPSAL